MEQLGVKGMNLRINLAGLLAKTLTTDTSTQRLSLNNPYTAQANDLDVPLSEIRYSPRAAVVRSTDLTFHQGFDDRNQPLLAGGNMSQCVTAEISAPLTTRETA